MTQREFTEVLEHLPATTDDTEPKKMIVAKCNPYHAKTHHHRERVLRYDMTTPIEWVIDDGFGNGLTESEALEALARIASQQDGVDYYDKESLREFVQMVKDDYECRNGRPFEGEVNTSWYKGEGFYSEGYPIYLIGDEYYTYDVITYEIQDFIPEDEE